VQNCTPVKAQHAGEKAFVWNSEQPVARLSAKEWQLQYLIEYRAQRKFSATNLRFKADATLEVMTTFRRPHTLGTSRRLQDHTRASVQQDSRSGE
jgi:hypothetical protein